ncbi:hypothetical protein IL306_009579 [Fusarium sp. DS 682]|nr:hypothetical protein IL306_009579 [Fusarium sp. DS 682]
MQETPAKVSASCDVTDAKREYIAGFLRQANKLLDRARRGEARINDGFQKKLGMTMEELQDAQMEEMNKPLDAEEDCTKEESEAITDIQDRTGMTNESWRPDSQRKSQHAESQRTDNS